jgi:hypothetical protein
MSNAIAEADSRTSAAAKIALNSFIVMTSNIVDPGHRSEQDQLLVAVTLCELYMRVK